MPFYSFHRKDCLFFKLFILQKNYWYKFIFKALRNSSLGFSFLKKEHLCIKFMNCKEIHYESVFNYESHRKSGFNHKEIGRLFINNETLHFSMFLKIISCLLYTSPSPRDLSTSRMPSSA